ADGGGAFVASNDPDARRTWLSYALNLVNVASYVSAFDTASMAFGGSSDETVRARRLVAEMANATRYSTISGENFVVARGAFDGLGATIDKLTSMIPGDSRANRRARRSLNQGFSFIKGLLPGFVGTGKLLTADGQGLPDLDDTRKTEPDYSALARGEAIAAKDTVPGVLDDFASVVSTPNTGRHCRYIEPGDFGTPFHVAHLFPIPIHLRSACRDNESDTQHTWQGMGQGGIQPFLKFSAQEDGFGVESKSFNQPDVWILLNKPPAGMALGGPGDLDFRLKQGPGNMVAELDARIGEDGVMGSGAFEGINVIARAQVYYHRPGAWREPPNFFNPYWGARLAPKGAALSRLSGELGLPGWAGELIADNVWMH
ncbi:MAG: hypothetical protein HYZ27_09365, partial [Deltaproteobacteria bacterium]|nr:hypothetical protein [Deltaproteobacteria bacterium]